MTCDYFDLNVKTNTVEIAANDCSMKVEMDVYYEDFVDALLHTKDNLDYIAEPLKDELIRRAGNEWDLGKISDDELNMFKTVMEMIL